MMLYNVIDSIAKFQLCEVEIFLSSCWQLRSDAHGHNFSSMAAPAYVKALTTLTWFMPGRIMMPLALLKMSIQCSSQTSRSPWHKITRQHLWLVLYINAHEKFCSQNCFVVIYGCAVLLMIKTWVQLYVVFVLADGGQDLESFVLADFDEARSVLFQVTIWYHGYV